jgi:hypothetical protein
VQPLGLDPLAFGELVHALISGALSRASLRNAEEAELAVAAEAQRLRQTWPIIRAVPPDLLWRHTVATGAERATKALIEGLETARGRSWTEIAFGQPAEGEHPWLTLAPVQIPGTSVVLRGRIDRLDHDVSTGAAIVTDFKVGKAPEKKIPPVFSGGRELQRVMYAVAVDALIPGLRSISAGLTYLGDDPVRTLSLAGEPLQKAIEKVLGYAAAGVKIQEAGLIAPGPEPAYPDFLALALPADREAYRRLKRGAFKPANAPLEKLWDSP